MEYLCFVAALRIVDRPAAGVRGEPAGEERFARPWRPGKDGGAEGPVLRPSKRLGNRTIAGTDHYAFGLTGTGMQERKGDLRLGHAKTRSING